MKVNQLTATNVALSASVRNVRRSRMPPRSCPQSRPSVINNAVNYFLSPLIGKAIIRYGERRVLSLEYFSLIFIFLAYAATGSKWIVALLYILDHIFFNFSIAIRTYFQKVGDPKDIAPSMAVGFTINHIAAVFLPAIGGYLWIVDYRIPFVGGAALSLISLTAVQMIRTTGKGPGS